MKAIFLDRDGVINKYPGDKEYVTSWRSFRFLPRVKRALFLLNRSRFKIFIVSNQAGVGKGIFSRKALDAITENMLREIKKNGGRIDSVYYCTHAQDENCSCRKPKAGLIHIARNSFPINLKDSFFIGDTIRDIKAAHAAGCKSILVFSGKEKLANRNNWKEKPDFVFRDLLEAVNFVTGQKR